MDRNARYAAINTKVLSLMGGLLKEEDYKKMISLQSPWEIAKYLKENTVYSKYFEDKDVENMHRDEMERCLKEGLIDYVEKLLYYFNGSYRNFFKYFYMRYEINDIKRLARIIHIEKDYENLKSNLVFAGRYKYIDVDRMVKAKSIVELINALDGTIYYPYLKNLLDGDQYENLFRFEMSLDRAYFEIIESNIGKLDKSDIEAYYNLYGSLTDMSNLQWIYRGKRYYNLSSEEIFNYTVNRGYKFNYNKIKKLCYTNSIDDFVNLVQGTPYGFMFKGDSKQDIYMERRMNRYMYYRIKSIKARAKMDISLVLAYLELIEFEIRDIISIIENVRYHMEYEEAVKYLIKAL